MASALQEKNAVIARLVSTVLCPAFDRGVGIAAGLDGFRKPVPIGNANLKVQDKPRGFRFSDDRTCHHGIRLAILVYLAPLMLLLGGSMSPLLGSPK